MSRGRKQINIQLVAKEAGVSTATVSRVLNHRTDVSEPVRARVQGVIEALDFTPDKSAQRRLNLGVIVSLLTPAVGDYTSLILSGVMRYAAEAELDATVIFNFCDERKKTLLQLIRERRCDAVALIFPEPVLSELDELDGAGVATMLINSNLAKEKMGFVDNASYGGSLAAMNLLLQLRHTRIGFLCQMLENNENHQNRLKAYRDALAKAGLVCDPRRIVEHQPTLCAAEAGYLQAKRLLAADPTVTAIFAGDDGMALGAIKACWEAGLRVPDDISVVGFNDDPESRFFHPALTTVRQPLESLGYRAARALDLYLRKKIARLPEETLETELIVRESTGPCPAR